jgi:hypothetical protein
MEEQKMINEEKLTHLLKVLKSYAEEKHCYERTPDYQPFDCADYNYAFEDGGDYGEIHFARTLLEQIGEKFEYPCEKENE